MDYKDSVVRMLAGESVPINIGTFSNDMTTFATKDDVLTLLVHLGYLTYNIIDGTVRIPNKEVCSGICQRYQHDELARSNGCLGIFP